MTAYTFDESIISDLHKDARGFRPYCTWWKNWNTASNEDKQSIWDDLLDELAAETAHQRKLEEKAIQDFEDRIKVLVNMGAKDRDTAVRWIVESLKLSETDKWYGGEYICHLLNLPFNMKEIFNRLVK